MKKFAGFTPQQKYLLLSKLGYKGGQDSAEMEKFLQASPQASAKLGSWEKLATERVSKNPKVKYAEGGVVGDQTDQKLQEAQAKVAQDPTDVNKEALQEAGQAFNTAALPSSSEALKTAIEDPKSVMTPANVDKLVETPDQTIQEGTGQQDEITETPTSTVDETAEAEAAARTDANTFEASTIGDKVEGATDDLQAATADPSAQATVRGQLAELMQDFEGDGTPPWASGAMREAMGAMQRRGLGASSVAGQAIVQAAMESAVGIASADAQTYAQFEMQNLNNEQQTRIFKTQQRIAGLFSDQAAENASKQFNAVSKNQTDQFFSELETTVSRFNTEQINSIKQFNTGEENTSKRFYSQLQSQREQFNAQNDLIIAQANTQWRQNIATTNSEAQNEANLQSALQANGLTQSAMDKIWQRERDLMNFAFASSESALDRNLSILLADKNIAQANSELDAAESASKRSALGYIAGQLVGGLF